MTLKQGRQTVEAFAATFVRTRRRIQVSDPVDTSSSGLNGNIERMLTATATVETMRNCYIDLLIAAATEAEASRHIILSTH